MFDDALTLLHVLHGKIPIPEPNTLRWAKWLEEADRQVALTELGDVMVSTIFLGIASHFTEDGPVIFETMVMGGPHHRTLIRTCTWEAAEECHAVMVKNLRQEMDLNAANDLPI